MYDLLVDKLNNIKMYARFCLGLREFLTKKMSLAEAKQIMAERMLNRQENFLKIIRRGMFEYKKSPYLSLFNLFNLSYKDIEKMVARYGIEETLKILKDDGIFFSIEEFKGRKATARKGKEFIFKEKDFDNPYTSVCYQRRSGGTSGAGSRIMADFDFLSQTATHHGFMTDVWDLLDTPCIILLSAFPYGAGMKHILQLSKIGIYSKEWISLYDRKNVPISFRSSLGIHYILYMSKIFGARFPKPKFVDLENIFRILDSISKVLKEYKKCCIWATVSLAIRICLAARERGISLSGTKFYIAGESLTPVKHKQIVSCGAEYILLYAFTEVGLVGSLCLNSSTVDDIHLFKDSLALISHKKNVLDSSVDAFLFTTLLSCAPKILLNVESGDYGIIETRSCACPYDKMGFNEHIREIRSFEKLNGEGMTFYGADFVRIIEEYLPLHFGGSSLDYQLIEEEDDNGLTHLFVLISPSLGPVDEGAVINTILSQLKNGNDSQRAMAEIWFQAGTIKVRRDSPLLTKEGKLYPLYISSRR